jgi:hypothetical protein
MTFTAKHGVVGGPDDIGCNADCDPASGMHALTETEGSPTFTTTVEAQDAIAISECPCCGLCAQLVEDGQPCQVCRAGLHEVADE